MVLWTSSYRESPVPVQRNNIEAQNCKQVRNKYPASSCGEVSRWSEYELPPIEQQKATTQLLFNRRAAAQGHSLCWTHHSSQALCKWSLSVMATTQTDITLYYLSEPLRFVHSGSMDKQGMKEHRVSRFHREMNPGSIGVKVPDAVIQLVHTSLNKQKHSNHFLCYMYQ